MHATQLIKPFTTLHNPGKEITRGGGGGGGGGGFWARFNRAIGTPCDPRERNELCKQPAFLQRFMTEWKDQRELLASDTKKIVLHRAVEANGC